MKKILITSGGTKEYIDEVRVLTNISTGKLGATIANIIQDKIGVEFELHFVYVKGSVLPEDKIITITPTSPDKFPYQKRALFLHEVTDVQSVYEIMEKLVPDMDVVIHPMAISDFGFKPTNTKLKSNDPYAFIESLKERIYQTPKILSFIKKWNPNCFLISFKFENNLEHDKLIEIARESLIKNNSDIVIANDKAEMKRNGIHKSYFVTLNDVQEIDGKENIALEILNKIK